MVLRAHIQVYRRFIARKLAPGEEFDFKEELKRHADLAAICSLSLYLLILITHISVNRQSHSTPSMIPYHPQGIFDPGMIEPVDTQNNIPFVGEEPIKEEHKALDKNEPRVIPMRLDENGEPW